MKINTMYVILFPLICIKLLGLQIFNFYIALRILSKLTFTDNVDIDFNLNMDYFILIFWDLIKIKRASSSMYFQF